MAFAALELCCQLTVQVGNAFLSRSRSNSLKFDLGTESRLSDFNPANVLMEEGRCWFRLSPAIQVVAGRSERAPRRL